MFICFGVRSKRTPPKRMRQWKKKLPAAIKTYARMHISGIGRIGQGMGYLRTLVSKMQYSIAAAAPASRGKQKSATPWSAAFQQNKLNRVWWPALGEEPQFQKKECQM